MMPATEPKARRKVSEKVTWGSSVVGIQTQNILDEFDSVGKLGEN